MQHVQRQQSAELALLNMLRPRLLQMRQGQRTHLLAYVQLLLNYSFCKLLAWIIRFI
jgi:hypothetical protein